MGRDIDGAALAASMVRLGEQCETFRQGFISAMQPVLAAFIAWGEDLQRAQLAEDLDRVPIARRWADWLASHWPRRWLPQLQLTSDDD
jgi:hypothetical protein